MGAQCCQSTTNNTDNQQDVVYEPEPILQVEDLTFSTKRPHANIEQLLDNAGQKINNSNLTIQIHSMETYLDLYKKLPSIIESKLGQLCGLKLDIQFDCCFDKSQQDIIIQDLMAALQNLALNQK